MKRRCELLAAMLFFLAVSLTGAQENSEKISIGHTLTISSKILGEDRNIFIYLPDGYQESEMKYPVLYLLDGEDHFHHGSGIVQFLSSNDRIPQTIVVGVPNTDRGRDFSLQVEKAGPDRCGADNFLSFLQDELMPLIDAKYRTRQYRILFGHSSTGMFSVYSFVVRPHLFNAHIAASPSFREADGLVIKKAEKLLGEESAQNKALYITLGDEPVFTDGIEKLTAVLKKFDVSGLEWKYVKMMQENHGSVVHKSIYQGLEFIFAGWEISAEQAKDFASIQSHYSSLTDKFGFTTSPSERLLNGLGYQVLGKNEYAHAIEIFKAAVKIYPNSDNVYDSLGEAYERSGEIESAAENYSLAIDKGRVSNSRNLDIYKANLKRVQALIK